MNETIRRPPAEIERLGFAALCECLGMADAIRFVQQFDLGRGDYTQQRNALFKEDTLEMLHREVEERRQRKTSS